MRWGNEARLGEKVVFLGKRDPCRMFSRRLVQKRGSLNGQAIVVEKDWGGGALFTNHNIRKNLRGWLEGKS